jgi:DNA (cytosine-5)-methyltransferase 1
MNFATVCSGIGAPEVAWADWNPVFCSEIEFFPCAVLKHHYPNVPNLGDMTKYKEWPDYDITDGVICAGTPCQAFSVAGLRKGLDDPRGNLTLVFLGILRRYRPRWMVWENVPGVLSDHTGAFGAFLGGLGQLGYGFAYRILDAQYLGVPQRRRRVFVVGHFGSWQRAAAVLFERHSLQGHSPPGRKAGKGTAADVAPSLTSSCRGVERTGESRGQDPLIALHGTQDPCISEIAFAQGRNGGQENVIAHSLRAEGFDASEDGTGRGTPLVCGTMKSCSKSGGRMDFESETFVAFAQNQRDEVRLMDVAGALAAEPGIKQQTYAQQGMQVRRLTPLECARLQGFPDNYLDIPFRVKPAADGPKYKALGNSMAVPVVRWIGNRINKIEELKL